MLEDILSVYANSLFLVNLHPVFSHSLMILAQISYYYNGAKWRFSNSIILSTLRWHQLQGRVFLSPPFTGSFIHSFLYTIIDSQISILFNRIWVISSPEIRNKFLPLGPHNKSNCKQHPQHPSRYTAMRFRDFFKKKKISAIS